MSNLYPIPNKPKTLSGLWSITILLIATALVASLGAMLALFTPDKNSVVDSVIDNVEIPSKQPNNIFPFTLTRPFNILVMGVDQHTGSGNETTAHGRRTDTLLLVRFDTKTQTINVLSIPRDTQVEVSNIGKVKINEVYGIGGNDLLLNTVQTNLHNINIDRYVKVSHRTFQELVDILGGVEIFVPADMGYKDNAQKLHINLRKGWQNLDGARAEQFVRFRNDGRGDIGRIQRQQIFLQSLWSRLKNPDIVPKLPQLIYLIQKHIETDLVWEEMMAIANFAMPLGADKYRLVMLPGEVKYSRQDYSGDWIIDKLGKERVMYQYFNVDPNGSEYSTAYVPNSDSLIDKKAKIAVQNASNNPAIANRLASFLAEQGFYNTYVVNTWPEVKSQTEIVVQSGDLGAAETIKSVMGLGNLEISSTGDLDSLITIRVGQDAVNKF
ncbi:MAG: LCP family protein [Microcoleaceae cyanobacterium]